MTDDPVFLTLDAVIRLHSELIQLYGGTTGIRDHGGLEAAVLQPQASFAGEYLYSYPAGMAATYVVGLAMNHPFLDGNKRIAAAAMGAFLAVNGWELVSEVGQEELAGAVLARVTGALARGELEVWLEQRIRQS